MPTFRSLFPLITQATILTTCDETSEAKIPNIAYIEDNILIDDGELIVQIDSSVYNNSALLGPSAGMAALSISSLASGGNYYEAV